MKEFKLKNANELEKLNYIYYEDDGFSEFSKKRKHNITKRLSFNRLGREIAIYEIKEENKEIDDIYFLNEEELKAIFKICKELGWSDK